MSRNQCIWMNKCLFSIIINIIWQCLVVLNFVFRTHSYLHTRLYFLLVCLCSSGCSGALCIDLTDLELREILLALSTCASQGLELKAYATMPNHACILKIWLISTLLLNFFAFCFCPLSFILYFNLFIYSIFILSLCIYFFKTGSYVAQTSE